MLVELSYCSKKKKLTVYKFGVMVVLFTARLGVLEKEKKRTSFSLISRYSWGSGETSSSRLPLLSAVTWFAGWTCGTRRSWTAVQWTRWNLVDQHVNSAHLTFQGEAERFWMRPMFDTTQRQTFFLLFFYAKGKFELTVNKLFTNLSGDGAHHALRRKVSLETKTFFLRRMKNKYRCVVSHSVEVEYKHHVGLSQFVDAH